MILAYFLFKGLLWLVKTALVDEPLEETEEAWITRQMW